MWNSGSCCHGNGVNIYVESLCVKVVLILFGYVFNRGAGPHDIIINITNLLHCTPRDPSMTPPHVCLSVRPSHLHVDVRSHQLGVGR